MSTLAVFQLYHGIMIVEKGQRKCMMFLLFVDISEDNHLNKTYIYRTKMEF